MAMASTTGIKQAIGSRDSIRTMCEKAKEHTTTASRISRKENGKVECC